MSKRHKRRMPNETAHTTAARKRAFLRAFGLCGNVTRAAAEVFPDDDRKAESLRQLHYGWLALDQAYAEAFRAAQLEAGDRLEQEAQRRAVEGWEEPVFHQGELAGVWVDADGKRVPEGDTRAVKFVPHGVRRYSDRLLERLLEGAKPEKYSRRFQHDVGEKTASTLADLIRRAGGNGDS